MSIKTTGKWAAMLLATILLLTACGTSGGAAPASEPPAAQESATTETAKDSASPAETTGDAASEASGSKEVVPGQVIDISISMFDRGAIPAEEGTYADWAGTRYINEQMKPYGVNITWVPVPRNEAQTKLNAMIAADMAPDVLWEYSRSWMNSLIQQKVIVPIEDAVNNYSTSYKSYYEANKDMIDPYITYSDGNKYAMANIRALHGLLTAGVVYRNDMLTELGMSEPQTIEEFLDVARAMKTLGDDIIPIAGSLHALNIIKGTYGISSSEIKAADGTVIPIFQSEKYKDFVTTYKTMYEEKLVDPEYVVDANYARQYQLWSSGKSGFFLRSWASSIDLETQALVDLDNTVEIKALPPLESKYGRFLLTPQPACNQFTMFTSKMDENKQKAAMAYMDYLLDGNWYAVSFGMEGEHYNLADGIRVPISGAPTWNGGEYALVKNDVYQKNQFARSVNEEQKAKGYLPLFEEADRALFYQFTYPLATVAPFDCSEEVYVDFNTEFDPKFLELETRIITDKSLSVEDGLALMQKEFENLGGVEAWQSKNEWYAANKATFDQFIGGFNNWAQGMLAELK